MRTPKQNAPGVGDPRAFALPREIGVTDLRKRNQSGEWEKSFAVTYSMHARRPPSRISGDVFGVATMARWNDM